MACYYPLRAVQLPSGDILVHKRTPGIEIKPSAIGRDLKLPCGRCIGCRVDRTKQWATRCLHESQQHAENCFLTLTIDPKKLSMDSLSKRIHQTFVKRLRRHTSSLIRYYMCGEYGEKLGKPHYHYLVFGYQFKDKKYWKTSDSGEKLYISATLATLWPHGHAWIGDVTYESCAYVAAYVIKKINGPMAEQHYRRTDNDGNEYWLQPEFNQMSRRPGIGKTWWEHFKNDVYCDDQVIHNGKKMRPPRYYDKLMQLLDPIGMAVIKMKRELRAKTLQEDNTPARLADKETVLKAKLSLKQRQYEK